MRHNVTLAWQADGPKNRLEGEQLDIRLMLALWRGQWTSPLMLVPSIVLRDPVGRLLPQASASRCYDATGLLAM